MTEEGRLKQPTACSNKHIPATSRDHSGSKSRWHLPSWSSTQVLHTVTCRHVLDRSQRELSSPWSLRSLLWADVYTGWVRRSKFLPIHATGPPPRSRSYHALVRCWFQGFRLLRWALLQRYFKRRVRVVILNRNNTFSKKYKYITNARVRILPAFLRSFI